MGSQPNINLTAPIWYTWSSPCPAFFGSHLFLQSFSSTPLSTFVFSLHVFRWVQYYLFLLLVQGLWDYRLQTLSRAMKMLFCWSRAESIKAVPLTCHGHSRPVTHLSFSSIVDDDQYYLISACKGLDHADCLSWMILMSKRQQPNASRWRYWWLVSVQSRWIPRKQSTNAFRIGTFIGHKGAVWQSRLSIDATLAATAAADFTAYWPHLSPAHYP